MLTFEVFFKIVCLKCFVLAKQVLFHRRDSYVKKDGLIFTKPCRLGYIFSVYGITSDCCTECMQ